MTRSMVGAYVLGCLGALAATSASGDAKAAEPERTKRADVGEKRADRVEGPTAEPRRHAREALERAARARAAGDRTHAPLLVALANAWTALAEDLERAADAEARASRLEHELNTIETKLIRARALLEETLARRGRAAAELRELEEGSTTAAETKQEAESQSPP